MKRVFARLASDFLSTIVFLVVYLATDNVLVATGVLYQGTTADLREVRGFPADQVLAAYIPAQRAGQTGSGWTFVAVDQTLGTNPLADPSASAVLQR